MRKFIAIIFSVFLFGILLLVYYKYNITESNWSIQCSFYKVTGLYCPGCGGQRSFHYLLHGNILQSFRYNILLLPALILLGYLYYCLIQIYFIKNESYKNKSFLTNRFAKSFLIVLILFFILRNIPIIPFTYLSPC